nr:HEPN domain-containing protein [Neorhizobium galegae]
MSAKPEFQLAASALNAGQFIPNSALTLISLMGALEAIFSPSKTELKFRVSSLIAAYLHPYGKDRLETQKAIGLLYDKRSAAAHGKPNHAEDDVLKAFELLRAVLIRMVEDGKVPSKAELELSLFGDS